MQLNLEGALGEHVAGVKAYSESRSRLTTSPMVICSYDAASEILLYPETFATIKGVLQNPLQEQASGNAWRTILDHHLELDDSTTHNKVKNMLRPLFSRERRFAAASEARRTAQKSLETQFHTRPMGFDLVDPTIGSAVKDGLARALGINLRRDRDLVHHLELTSVLFGRRATPSPDDLQSFFHRFGSYVSEWLRIGADETRPWRDVLDRFGLGVVLANLWLCWSAGLGTTERLTSSALVAYLQRHALSHEQVIRASEVVACPIQHVRRVAIETTELADYSVNAGDHVLVFIAAANLDERRGSRPPLTFGAGMHRCLGSDLARELAYGLLQEIRQFVVSHDLVVSDTSYSTIGNYFGCTRVQLVAAR